MLNFFLCFRSELATEVVLHGAIRLYSNTFMIYFERTKFGKTDIDFEVGLSSRAVHISSRAVRISSRDVRISSRAVRISSRDVRISSRDVRISSRAVRVSPKL